MIFNDEFDKSLGLMIKGDIKNRKKIVDFVKSIPYELILDIRESLIEYSKYKIKNNGVSYNDREYRYFNKQIYNNVGELYSFNIDVRNEILTVTKSIYVMGAYYKNFSIELICLDKIIDSSKINNIGKIYFSVDGGGKFKKISYGIMDIGLTNILVSSVNDDIYSFCRFLNINKDFDLELSNNSGKLVRTKKINNGDDNRYV